jgi:Cu2+-exporting ATPase
VQIVATGRLFKRGVFVKSGDALERLAQIDCVVLDKTGTLTLGRPELVTHLGARQLEAAAALARASRHPLSRALAAAAGPGRAAEGVAEHPGQGLEALVEGVRVRLGAKAFAAPDAAAQAHAGEELWLAIGAEPPVQVLFRDALRADAAAVVRGLQARGLDGELLSGDRIEAVAAAAEAAGLAHWRGGVDPKGKVARLAALQAQGRKPLMVGDGLNDAAALAAAHVSASPGSAIGASQAASDLVFQGALLGPVLEAVDVARAARRRVAENLAFSALYNVLAVPFAAAGLVTPLIAAVAMSASSLVVTVNALRLSRGGAGGGP